MGTSKTDDFTIRENRTAMYAKALGHPARLAILKLLLKRNTCICGDIVEELPLSQSTVSQHLKALKEAGLIRGEIEGPKTCYCIDPDGWNQAKREFEGLFQMFNPLQGTCC